MNGIVAETATAAAETLETPEPMSAVAVGGTIQTTTERERLVDALAPVGAARVVRLLVPEGANTTETAAIITMIMIIMIPLHLPDAIGRLILMIPIPNIISADPFERGIGEHVAETVIGRMTMLI